jgi:GNAT superfamily N-acetyltransferase
MSSAVLSHPAPPRPFAARHDLERVEAAGYADLFHAAPPELARRHGIALAPLAGGLCLAVAAKPGDRIFNRATGIGRWGHASDAGLDRVERFYAERGLSHLVSICDRGQAVGLDRRLRVVRRVDRERAGEWAEIVTSVFGAPEFAGWFAALPGRQGWSCFMALDGDRPMAAAGLFVDGDAAWMTFGATLPEYRRRGAQRALLAARLMEAYGRGCSVVVTETGEPAEGRPNASYRNLRASGFDPRYRRPNLRSPS